MSDDIAFLKVHGGFALLDGLGCEYRIPSIKVRALLVLLACSESGKRQRSWLAGMLWSTSDPEQALSSLRQCLRQLRVALDQLSVSISANRDTIELDKTTLRLEPAGAGEFLEGFVLRETPFMTWVFSQRSRSTLNGPKFATPTEIGSNPWELSISSADLEGVEGWISTTFCDGLARSLRETQSIAVSVDKNVPVHDQLIKISVQVFLLAKDVGLSVSIDRPASRRQIWSGRRTIPYDGALRLDHPGSLALVQDAVAAIDQYLYSNSYLEGHEAPDRFYRQAVRDLFSMEAARVTTAGQLLNQAYELSPRGLFLAMRAQHFTIQRVEQFATNIEALEEEAEYCIKRAYELEPDNSMVLALLSNTSAHLMRDFDRSVDFAIRSVQINPNNAMAWWSLSSAHLYVGRVDEARRCAQQGRRLAGLSQLSFWWDQQRFGAAFIAGDFTEALQMLKTVNAQNPSFRPPLRYLIALHAHFGDLDAARKYTNRLRTVEPDFSLQRMLFDNDYPASLLRIAPGLSLDGLKEL
ncbi:MAG: tetratricopeptide repeat protein [Paracoccaceae bacterium]